MAAKLWLIRILGASLAILLAGAADAAAPKIEITFLSAVSDKPYTGRVLLMTTRRERGRPMDGPSWFGTEPFFGLDVKDWKPGEALQFDPEKAIGYPSPLAELPAGRYRLQAVIDLNGWSHDVAGAPGNGYSEIQTLEHDPEQPTALHLEIAKTVPVRELKDTESTKFIRLKSRLLSEFYHHDVYLRAAVGFPDSYDEDKQKRYPAVYTIPGFGGTINNAGRGVRSSEYAADGFEPIVIFLDPDCPTGHHVFADSANNGPRGQALIEELIPYLEREFRLIPEVGARFVTGHSSGGWSSLWLQVAYPDTFGGVWSGSPDPVDFTAFQTIDIYDEKENMFTLADGSPRPLSRGDWGSPLLTKSFCLMEETVGRGGQLQSFEAVFSPRGPDGRPRQLWNRQTGKLDAAVAQAWRRYDIREIVAHDWSRLGPKLKGKLHLFCGDKDTFLLEGAFFKLRDALERLGSDAYVEVIPGAGHGLPPSVHRKMVEQMAASAAANATHRK